MIQLIDICKSYHVKNAPDVKALDHVNLTFGEKGLVFILGKSGSGKSTLLNVIGGLDHADSGDLVIMGKSSKDFSQAEFDSYRNTYLGFIFQEYNILNEFTIGQNIALAMQLQNQKEDRAAVEKILDEVDLHGLYERKPNELSGGQKQRVAIARALVKNPQVIMADEPTGALDSKTGKAIFDTLKKLAQSHLVIVVSHDRDFAESFGDRVIEIKDGQVASDISKTYHEGETTGDGVQKLGNSLLSFKAGHVLTSEDITLLNAYFAKAEGEALVSVDGGLNQTIKTSAKIDESGRQGSFVTTTPELVGETTYQGPAFHLVKSKLPFNGAFKLAVHSLRSKPFRLVMTVILVLCSLVLFGLTGSLATYSPKAAFLEAFSGNENIYGLTLEAQTITRTGEYGWGTVAHWVSEDETKTIAEATGMPFAAYPTLNELASSGQNDDETAIISAGTSLGMLSGPYSRTIKENDKAQTMIYNPEAAQDSLVYFEGDYDTLASTYRFAGLKGVYPTSQNQVAVSAYYFHVLQHSGYSYYELSEGVDRSGEPTVMANQVVLTPEECASEELFLSHAPKLTFVNQNYLTRKSVYANYQITAVIDPAIDLSFAEGAGINSPTDYTKYTEWYNVSNRFSYLTRASVLDAVYGLSGLRNSIASLGGHAYTASSRVYERIYSSFNPADQAGIAKLFEFLNKYNSISTIDPPKGKSRCYTFADNETMIIDPAHPNRMYSSASASVSMLTSAVSSLRTTFFWFGFGTACFAALLLATFIASSIGYQKRQIGILRAIGARGKDVASIFLLESLLITLTSSLFALILTAVLDNVISRSFMETLSVGISLFQFGIIVVLMVLGLAIITGCIAAALPCFIISKKKPIDSINDR